MAIDSRRKRASIAVLGLAFLGPSVVPDGTLGTADRQVIASSYYGITSGVVGKTLGDVSQLEVLTSTGGLDETSNHTIGDVSQLEAFASTGGLTVTGNVTLGDTSQLQPFTSTGGIQVGAVAVVAGGIHNAAAYFPTGSSVTITLYDPLVAAPTAISVTSDACVEVGTTGLYMWDMSKLTTLPQPYKEYGYVMTDNSTKVGGIVAYDDFFSQYLVHSNMI